MFLYFVTVAVLFRYLPTSAIHYRGVSLAMHFIYLNSLEFFVGFQNCYVDQLIKLSYPHKDELKPNQVLERKLGDIDMDPIHQNTSIRRLENSQ